MTRNLPSNHLTDNWKSYDWRARGLSFPDRLAELAARFPERLAAYDPVARLTYRELDRATNRVAHAILAARGTAPEAVIIFVSINTTSVIAATGALRAGKFYVGMEPSFTLARAAKIIDDAQAKLILTESRHLPMARQLAGSACQVLDVETLPNGYDHPPGIHIDLNAIALLVYTSGSTGQPKGVVHTHRSMLAQAVRYANAYHLSKDDRLVTFGSLAWAGSFWDLFGALALGSTVATYDVRQDGLPRLAEWLGATRVTVLSGMTVAHRIAHDFANRRYPFVRLLQLGGDTVYRRDVEACQQVFPNGVMAIGLGTTETGRVAEMFLPPGATLEQDPAPIGHPVSGVHLSICSEDGDDVEPGEVGELVVQSAGLARGYWQRPALTAEKFRQVAGRTHEFRYFTGDLGRQLDNGLFLHQGRKDFQVKIRGYQAPTNEIEAKLIGVGGICEACVVAVSLPTGIQELIAYLVADDDVGPAVESLRSQLRVDLPDYMIPHRFVYLETLPRTPNGKINRRLLPSRTFARPLLKSVYVGPCTPFEGLLCAIWSEVLDVDAVGVDDEFLALGGDSLRAIQVFTRVKREFGISLSLADVLTCGTVAELATVVGARILAQAGGWPAGADTN